MAIGCNGSSMPVFLGIRLIFVNEIPGLILNFTSPMESGDE
jgi:hypothetical protein